MPTLFKGFLENDISIPAGYRIKNKEKFAKKVSAMKTKIARGSLLVAAVVLLILGIVQNGHVDVRNKAIRICYECIGIG